ncbi:hypothetical protein LTR10_007273 [Elasticomyces elasticus]|nr:hypothetical protein LTR10_007273 [Elasticomyces elasticus]
MSRRSHEHNPQGRHLRHAFTSKIESMQQTEVAANERAGAIEGGIDGDQYKSKQTSPLLALPSELRNRIWELCVIKPISQDADEPCRDHAIVAAGRRLSEVQHAVQQPPLTRVCCQVRDETLPMYYSGNVFAWSRFDRSFGVDPYASRAVLNRHCAVVHWAEAIGERNRGWLKDVLLRYTAGESDWRQGAENKLNDVVNRQGVVRSERQEPPEYWWEIAVEC